MRVVSLLPAATDIVAALGAADQLVGRTHECDWPAEVVARVPVVTRNNLPDGWRSREIAGAITDSGHEGSSLYYLDQSALEAMRPDLILTQDLCEVCAVSYRTVTEAVRVLQLDTMVVSLEARTIEQILGTVEFIGDLLDVRDEAQAICADAVTRLDRLPGPTPDGPSVLFVEWLDPLMPGGHWVPEQIRWAGGRPLISCPGDHSVPNQWSTVIDLRPEVVVFGPCGFRPEQTFADLNVATRQPGWADLPAVRNGNVWVVDGPSHFNRPGQRVIDGAETLAALLAGRDTAHAWRVTGQLLV